MHLRVHYMLPHPQANIEKLGVAWGQGYVHYMSTILAQYRQYCEVHLHNHVNMYMHAWM